MASPRYGDQAARSVARRQGREERHLLLEVRKLAVLEALRAKATPRADGW